MKWSVERSELGLDSRQADVLFDVLGFSGEPREYDEVDAMIAMKDFLLVDHNAQTEGGDIERTVIRVCRALRNPAYSDDERASAALGWTVGRKVSTDTDEVMAEDRVLIDRAFRNMQLRREVWGQGSLDLFYGGFLEAACTCSSVAPSWQQKHIRRVVAYTARHQHSLRKRELSTERPSIWPHIVRGLASIAMIEGYKIVPPADQTDTDGSWRIPEQRESDEDDR